MHARVMTVITAIALSSMLPRHADAFCGVYVNGVGSNMFNHATQVVLVRVGTRTVLSMQNNYQGPPDGFAMVIPVPVVLKEADVKTLPPEVFAKVDEMGSPRLVEYWEQDPCLEEVHDLVSPDGDSISVREFSTAGGGGGSHGVTVEAEFIVGEYQIVILSARESSGLETWLRAQGYKIPANVEPLLRPYVQNGSKFFVAKVDPTKVKLVGGVAQLSPLRFHYDADELVLPIRLGLANSAGTQDLIVNVLGAHRFEVANRKNVFIPTNLDVRPEVRARFGEFYAALFDRTIAQHPAAVVTEYAWSAFHCDPCPGPALDGKDFGTLGYDVIAGKEQYDRNIVLTRLHLRYGKDSARDDLVFKHAAAVAGGREERSEHGNVLEQGAGPADYDAFQARYAIRHRWTGKVTCKDPTYDRWAGTPTDGTWRAAQYVRGSAIAFAPRGQVKVEDYIDRTPARPGIPAVAPSPRGCGCGVGSSGGLAAAFVTLAFLRRRRRRP